MKTIINKHALWILLTSIAALFCFSCDDAGVTTDENQFCITAKLSDWIPGNKILYANMNSAASGMYRAAECPVDGLGNFNLCLPSLSDTTLYSSDSIFYSGCTGGNVIFNPPDVKGTQIYNFRVRNGDTIVGAVDCNNFTRYDSLKAGDFEVMFIYVNKNVTVSGYKVCAQDTLMFNGSAKLGWNKVIKHYTRVSSNSKTKLYDMNEPPGAVWEYHGD